jgi:hypothetical protein
LKEEEEMSKKVILGVQISNRVKNVAQAQKVLTEHGCNIKTRLGLHEVGNTNCSPSGLLLIETFGRPAEIQALEKKLKRVAGLVVRKMVF